MTAQRCDWRRQIQKNPLACYTTQLGLSSSCLVKNEIDSSNGLLRSATCKRSAAGHRLFSSERNATGDMFVKDCRSPRSIRNWPGLLDLVPCLMSSEQQIPVRVLAEKQGDPCYPDSLSALGRAGGMRCFTCHRICQDNIVCSRNRSDGRLAHLHDVGPPVMTRAAYRQDKLLHPFIPGYAGSEYITKPRHRHSGQTIGLPAS